MEDEQRKTCYIAIVDDNEEEAGLIKHLTDIYFENNKAYKYEADIYTESDKLVSMLREGGYYDIFFLDVEMPRKTGLQVAKEIRRCYQEPFIVFVTNYVQYAIPAFEVNAFRYIPKSMLSEKLAEAYNHLLPKLELFDQRVYLIERTSGIEKILYKNIFYISKYSKYLTIHHRHGETKVRKSLSEMLKELNSSEFIYIDKSCVVNLIHIASCKKDEIIMTNGDSLRISRPRYKQVRERIIEYWRNEK